MDCGDSPPTQAWILVLLNMFTNRHDFAWKPRKKNPYWGEDGGDKNKKNILRPKFLLSVAGLSLMVTAALWLFHPFFSLHEFLITGNERTAIQEITQTTTSILGERILWLIPKKNYLLADTNEIEEILTDRFGFAQSTVKKRFPNTLEISVEEKLSTIVYDNGSLYGIMDSHGIITELLKTVGEDEWTKIATSSIVATTTKQHYPDVSSIQKEFGALPIVYDKRHVTLEEGAQVLKPEEVSRLIEWYEGLKNSTRHLEITLFIIDSTGREVIVETGEGWQVQFVLADDPDILIERLFIALTNGQLDSTRLSSIDLRFGERIYWR